MKENTKNKKKEQKNPTLVLLLLVLSMSYAAVILYRSMQNKEAVITPVSAEEPVFEEPAVTAPEETAPPVPQVQREIYLTFDDGPCVNTPQVLDILDQYGAKATFFTVGRFVETYPEYAAEAVRRGHLIACHTYTHDMSLCYASADAFMTEIGQWERAVTDVCGALPEKVCVRFPGGSTTKYAAEVSDEIKERLLLGNYRWFDWNAGDNDKWKKGNVNNLPDEEYYLDSYRQCMNWYRDTPETPVVFLFHDTEIGTVHVLPEILQDLQERGYAFRLLSEHPDWNQ